MLERILLATVITFCIYLFLNLGEKSSNQSNIGGRDKIISGLVYRVTSSFSFQ